MIVNTEEWQSGRLHHLGKVATVKGPWVRIPSLPPEYWKRDREDEGSSLLMSQVVYYSLVGSNPTVSARILIYVALLE